MKSFILIACCIASAAAGAPLFTSVDPVFTPYNADGSVNYDAIPSLARYSEAQGVEIVLLGGSTGEWPSLSADERLGLLKAWRAATALPVMFHAGHNDVRIAKQLAAGAEQLGADSILVVSPCVFKPATVQELVAILSEIAAAAPKTPFCPSNAAAEHPQYCNERAALSQLRPGFLIVAQCSAGPVAGYYHYPGLYGVDFEIADVLTEATTGAHTVPTLAGIKFIDQDMKALSLAKAVANPWSADNAPFGIFVQSDYCLAAIPFGANGSPVITFQSPILHAIRDAYVRTRSHL